MWTAWELLQRCWEEDQHGAITLLLITHTHTNTGGHVLYMYITPCDTPNMSTEALLWPSYLCHVRLSQTQVWGFLHRRCINLKLKGAKLKPQMFLCCEKLTRFANMRSSPLCTCFSSISEYWLCVAIRLQWTPPAMPCWVALEFPRHDGAGDSHIWRSDPFQVSR